MNYTRISFISLVSILVMVAAAGYSQTTYTITNHNLQVLGTSNVHDWVINAETVKGDVKITMSEDGAFTINSLVVEIPVAGLKSEKGNLMDKKTYKALLADDHPLIRFTVKSNSGALSGDRVSGMLCIAGVEKWITLDGEWRELPNRSMVYTGSKAMKMTDFGIDPPTAMLGAMKTGDDITVEFSVTLQEK